MQIKCEKVKILGGRSGIMKALEMEGKKRNFYESSMDCANPLFLTVSSVYFILWFIILPIVLLLKQSRQFKIEIAS
jgi:hypothetical protein